MNCGLSPAHPHVGPGVQGHRQSHPDQHLFQQILTSRGLDAMNTWGKAGSQAGTFLQLQQHTVQIDFLLTRLPCHTASMRAQALRSAPVVHPTGLRHVPVRGFLQPSARPRHSTSGTLRPHQIQQRLQAQPDLAQVFQSHVHDALKQCPAGDIDECLTQAWSRSVARHSHAPAPASDSLIPEISLKRYWNAKQQIRKAQQATSSFLSPVVWHFSAASPATVLQHFPTAIESLRPLLRLWRAARDFHRVDKQLRKRVKERKIAKVDALIEEAQELDCKGIGALHLVVRRIRPKQPKRSIHFRTPEGLLMGEHEEVNCLRDFFADLYQSDGQTRRAHVLQDPFDLQEWEVLEALRSLPARKALPPGQAPALLWKLALAEVAPALHRTLHSHLQPGPLQFPPKWHDSHLTLLDKPGKPPNCPANLRPINLLPAESKLLARIAARRLHPYVAKAVQSVPQFAYVAGRQCADAIDRALSHCARIRAGLQSYGRNAWSQSRGPSRASVYGGLQLSLDLAKAYDRLPRHLLRSALDKLQAPESLITLILFIHDSAHCHKPASYHGLCEYGSGCQTGMWVIAITVDCVHFAYPRQT